MKDKEIIGSDWCDKYVTQIQDNNHQINNTRNWIKFKKLLNQVTFPDSITAVMYVALHIHKYYILFDKQIWKRYGMTGNDTESGRDNSLKDIIIKYGHGEEIKTLSLEELYKFNIEDFHIYEGISCIFDKEEEQNMFNICAPYPAKIIQNPNYRKIQYFLDFLRDVACHETEDLYHWFLKYPAHTCQY